RPRQRGRLQRHPGVGRCRRALRVGARHPHLRGDAFLMRSGSRDPAAPRRGWRSRSMLALAFALGACAPDAAGGADQAPDGRIVLSDVAGREVSLPGPAERVLLGEGRQLVALALLHPNPGSLVAGWLGDFEALDPAT